MVCSRESEGEVNTLILLDINQQALRKIGRQGLTLKILGERKGKLTISLVLLPVEATDDRGQGHSSGVIWRGGGRRKDDWLVDRIFAPKGQHALKKFERESLVSGGTALRQVAVFDELREKEKNQPGIWKSVKDKYSQNRFPFPNFEYWKVVCIKKTVWRLRHFYSSKRKRKKRKKKKDCWETFVFDVFLLAKYFRCLKREKRTVSWVPSLFVLIGAY